MAQKSYPAQAAVSWQTALPASALVSYGVVHAVLIPELERCFTLQLQVQREEFLLPTTDGSPKDDAMPPINHKACPIGLHL